MSPLPSFVYEVGPYPTSRNAHRAQTVHALYTALNAAEELQQRQVSADQFVEARNEILERHKAKAEYPADMDPAHNDTPDYWMNKIPDEEALEDFVDDFGGKKVKTLRLHENNLSVIWSYQPKDAEKKKTLGYIW